MKIEEIIKTLEKEKVKYAVIGGVAVVLHGYVRFTADIDLIIDFSEENVGRFVSAIDALNFRPGVPIDPMDIADGEKRKAWIRVKNAKVITFYNRRQPSLQIDVLLTKNLSQIRSIRMKFGDFGISVIAYDDLLKMKKETGRPTDLIDIERLREIRRLKTHGHQK